MAESTAPSSVTSSLKVGKHWAFSAGGAWLQEWLCLIYSELCHDRNNYVFVGRAEKHGFLSLPFVFWRKPNRDLTTEIFLLRGAPGVHSTVPCLATANRLGGAVEAVALSAVWLLIF